MFCASISGDVTAIERLLKKDPLLVSSWYEYRTALSFAVRENQVEAAAMLLQRGADPINSGTPDTLVEIARDRGYVEMQQLLEKALGAGGKDPAANGERSPWPFASGTRRKFGACSRLLQNWCMRGTSVRISDSLGGHDPSARHDRRSARPRWRYQRARSDGARPIHLTNGDYMYRGWRDVPKDLVTTPDQVYAHLRARGADVDMGMAAVQGDLERVRELLVRDPSSANRLSDYGSYYLGCGAPIKNAAAAGHIEIVRLLLQYGADPNLPEPGIAPRGHALYSAVANGHFEVAKTSPRTRSHPERGSRKFHRHAEQSHHERRFEDDRTSLLLWSRSPSAPAGSLQRSANGGRCLCRQSGTCR
jgi:hypothetical protein